MTGRAPNALVHVNTVIEVGIVGKIVDPDPLDRFTGAKTGANWFEIRTVSPDLLMTVHASF